MMINILGIESSCDDTAAAVVQDGFLLSSLIAGQQVHKDYGGVVPELASRAHQQNIVPVVDQAIKKAGISAKNISAVAFTRGPGLLGSLMVGTSFAKGFALAMDIPLIGVNHLQAHIMVHFIRKKEQPGSFPRFPFICLLVSGGHTQLVMVKDHLKMNILGHTIDDAAGEAFDKCGKILGFPYPGGGHIDRIARQGNQQAFAFTKPKTEGLDFSFSGLKTAFLYLVRDEMKKDPSFIQRNLADLAASLQKTIVDMLVERLTRAAEQTRIQRIALAGGVSANSGLREAAKKAARQKNWELFMPETDFATDNAAMIAITGYHKHLKKQFSGHDISPQARLPYE